MSNEKEPQEIIDLEARNESRKQYLIDKAVSLAWVIFVAVISTYVTIRVSIAEIQTQIKQNHEDITRIEANEERLQRQIRILELDQRGSTTKQDEIFRRLEKIDHNQEELMRLLGAYMTQMKNKK